MKQGWEIKKLGEIICEHSVRNKQDYDYPVYSVTNSAGFCRDYFSKEVASKDKKTYKIVPKGYFAYNPSRINVGSVDWQRHEDNVIVSPLYVVFGTDDTICQDYLLHYLKSSSTMALIQNHATGTVRANLKFDILSQFAISLPPIAEQEKIVAELDCLSGIIEKKKQQLKELDNLAQSIFYEMFGSVDDNHKNHEIRTLSEVFSIIKDGTHQTPQYIDDKEIGFKFLSAKDVVGGVINWENIKYISEDLHNELYKRVAPQMNDILLCKNGTYGICALVETDAVFDIYVSLALLRPKESYVPKYLVHAINNPSTKSQFDGSIKGIGVPNLHLGEIKKTNIIVPPLTLQQDFASKIEAIEKQKELIAQSIKETETLFNSRMDYYFN